ncbi:MAG: methyltransferase family protein [Armatimonadota bacterium]
MLILKTFLFTTVASGTIAVIIPLFLLPHPPLRYLTFAPDTAFGMALFLAGTALYSWCAACFVLEGRGTPAPFDPPRRLVAVGPYRVVRNPMYLAGTIALFGEALLLRSFWHLGYTAAFLAASHIRVVFWEEPALRRAFGRDYEEYCRRVPRWFPRHLRLDA